MLKPRVNELAADSLMLLKRDWRISTCQCATYIIVPSLASAHLTRIGELDGLLSVSSGRQITKSEYPLTNSPPVSGIEDLREKREEINEQITLEEDEKSKVQGDLTVLSKRLTTLNDSIARKVHF